VDANAWQIEADEMGIDEVRILDLADVQRAQRAPAARLPDWTMRITRVPPPEGKTLTEYAEALGAPALNPAAGANAAHLAHLVEDAEQLHRLMEAGIETYGQLASMASHGAVDAYIPDGALARARARACVLDAFAEARGIGRGRPVTREVLLAAGVSERYIDAVTDMARERDADAKRLIQALRAREDERAKGFRQRVLDSLAEGLTESGYLDPREPLDEDAVRQRVLAAANEVIKDGTLDAAEVRELFERLWELCGGREG